MPNEPALHFRLRMPLLDALDLHLHKVKKTRREYIEELIDNAEPVPDDRGTYKDVWARISLKRLNKLDEIVKLSDGKYSRNQVLEYLIRKHLRDVTNASDNNSSSSEQLLHGDSN